MNITRFIIPLLSLLLLTSCQKEIHLDLQNSPPRLVIQADYSALRQSLTVVLSRSVSLDSANVYPRLSGATVTITNPLGEPFIASECTGDSVGIYVCNDILVQNGDYRLSVVVDNRLYTSTCPLPEFIPLDSLVVKRKASVNPFVKDTTYALYPFYADPVGIGNSYRFRVWIDGELLPNIIIQSDAFVDGQYQGGSISTRGYEIKAGDTIVVELQHIDPAVYVFYSELLQAMSPLVDAPANPTSNITGGVLGYFSAYQASADTIIVRFDL